METTSDVREQGGRGGRRARWLAKRLGLALGAAALALVLLEIVVRLVDPAPVPREIGPGFYQLAFPLVNGRADGRWAGEPPENAAPLEREKRPGELRVVTFGESSAEGCPWGQLASPAAFLHEYLTEWVPDREITVVNAGKTSSFTMDSYYYLVEVLRYEPDYVIYYQGGNDRFDLDPEMCRVVTAPRAHAAWRWLVEHSRLVWALRTLGPELYLSLGGGVDQDGSCHSAEEFPDLCDPAEAFAAWADLLVAKSQEAGAKTIVVGFVESDLKEVAYWLDEGQSDSPVGKQLALCPLDPDCDPAEILSRSPEFVAETPQDPEDEENTLEDRNQGWRDAARRYGAPFVDFTSLARELPAKGAWAPPLFVDGVHLSVAGYAILGEQMARAVVAAEEGTASPEEGFWRPEGDMVDYYEAVRSRTLDAVAQCDLLLSHAELYFASDRKLYAGYAWRDAFELCPPERVQPGLDRYRAYVEGVFGSGADPDT